jgi:hypothetical protein
MARSISIVGWHIHPEAGRCTHCNASATVMAEGHDDQGFPEVFDLCDACLKAHYEVAADKVDEVFRGLGF